MSKSINIGVDVGNFDTKSQNTVTPSGFVEYSDVPFGVKEYLELDGKFYAQTPKRFTYVKNKATNENMYILTLMAIAKEIIANSEKQNAKKKADAQADKSKKEKVLGVQGEISLIDTVNLGVGLPLSHYSMYKKDYIEYYETRMSEYINFKFAGYDFHFKLGKIGCYPQDLSAVVTYKPTTEDSIIKTKKKTYYAVDIGGWTVDMLSVVNNELEGKGASKSLGVLAMDEDIINEVDVRTGVPLQATDIEDILMGETTYVSDEVKKIVNDCAKAWFNKIVDELVQNGMLIQARPTLFLGGGSQLFKKYIKECGKFVKYEFINNQKANARGYAKLITNS